MPKVVKSTVNVEGRVSETFAIVEGDELPVWGENEELGIVGQPAPRVDGAARVSGEARYTYDIRLAGMAYAHVVRATQPSATISRIDVAKAKALRGVLDVMTFENVGAYGIKGGDRLLSGDVRFIGQAIAVIVAVEPAIATAAAALLEIDYQPRPFVADLEAAARDDAPVARPSDQNNLFKGKPSTSERGDVDAGFAAADAVVEVTVRTPTQVHNALETHGCVAHWEGDQLTIYESTQHAFGVREFAARKLDLPMSKVRAIGTFMGGGFGAKFPGWAYTPLAAALAKKLRRPVHFMYDREGENLEAGNRGQSVQHVKIGARRDGTLTALEFRSISEGGADMGWLPMLDGPSRMMYRCPNVRSETSGVFTNLGPTKAFRAPGFVEGMVGLEAAMDELANALGMDPLELRRKNIPDADQLEEKPFSSFPIDECYRRGAAAIGWDRRNKAGATENGRFRRGIGMSSQIWWGGGGPPAYAEMLLNSDGTATVMTGTQDLGTGVRTILAQVAAEEFGLPLDAVGVTIGDTLQGPFGPGSGGSVTTGSMTPAVRSAANDLRKTFVNVVAQMLDTPEAEIELRNGEIYRRDDRLSSVREIMGKLGDVMLTGKGSRGPNDENVSVVTSGAQFAEVEVDTVTGRVKVLKIVAAHDSGRIMNPQTFNSQIYGGVIQGLGYALTEQRVVDTARGVVLNPNLEFYKLPTIADVPPIENILIDIPDVRANTTGAKGAGEPGIIPTAAAIANAVANALGKRVAELPITPGRVLEIMEEPRT